MTATTTTDSLFQGYAYAYPHKTAYQAIDPPIPLTEAWADEKKESLFLYVHIPFCEMRCGFCNLFTTLDAGHGRETAYLDALERQGRRVREALGEARFARFAVGGGTPTFLSAEGIERVFRLTRQVFGIAGAIVPSSIETSPATAQPDKLRLLREWGIQRISIGVQSFIESETAAIARPQKSSDVHAALSRIRETGFPVMNIDLMYGLPGQSLMTWSETIAQALRYDPEELYLYPLYVRPETGLAVCGAPEVDRRQTLYRAGCDQLRAAGYRQVSMRLFQRGDQEPENSLAYCCQEDGMVGIGCGARSYTRSLHYSNRYAVSAYGVRRILEEYVATTDARFGLAEWGFRLDEDEQRRRYVIKSLLHGEGLLPAGYLARFGTPAAGDFPILQQWAKHGLIHQTPERLRLTELGLERSDCIGPWLYSPEVNRRLDFAR